MVRPQVFQGAVGKTIEEVGIVGDPVRPNQVFVRFTDGMGLRVRACRDGDSAILESRPSHYAYWETRSIEGAFLEIAALLD